MSIEPSLYETVRYFLRYNPETGAFIRRCGRGNGTIAGTLRKKQGYINISLLTKQYPAHRLAWVYMTGLMPIGVIDHINGKRDDNRWENLRDVSHPENCRNATLKKNSTSGVTGVHWDKHFKKWTAYINVQGTRKNLGYFSDFVIAVQARLKAEHKYGYHTNHGRQPVTQEI